MFHFQSDIKLSYLVDDESGSGTRLRESSSIVLPVKGELTAGSASLKISYREIS